AAEEIKAVWVCWAWVVAPLITLGFATKVLTHFSRIGTFSWILLAPALICMYRMIARATAPAARTTSRRAAIAGISTFTERLVSEIQKTPHLALNVVGVFDDRAEERLETGCAVLRNDGTFAQLVAAAREGTIDIVYIALPLRAELRVKALIRDLQDTTASVYLAFDFASLAGEGYEHISHVDGLPVVPLLAGTSSRSATTRALSFVRAVRNGERRQSRVLRTHGARAKSATHSTLDAERGDNDLHQHDGTEAAS
ncbi:MAG: hypothetical protein RL701_2378, partial [Pseudomonadota bacterium]